MVEILRFISSVLNNRLLVIGLCWGFVWVWNFGIRLEHTYEAYGLKYKEEQNKNQDCINHKLASGSFINECQQTAYFLSKPRWWRTVVDTMAESGLCGKQGCLEFLLGPNVSFGEKVIQIVLILSLFYVLFLLLTFTHGITKNRTKDKNEFMMYGQPSFPHTTTFSHHGKQPHVVEIGDKTL